MMRISKGTYLKQVRRVLSVGLPVDARLRSKRGLSLQRGKTLVTVDSAFVVQRGSL